MRSEYFAYRLFPVALALAIAVVVTIAYGHTDLGVPSALGLFQSPISTPSSVFDSPLPTPLSSEPALSEAAQSGLAYISKRENVPIEALIVAADHPTEYPASGRRFQVVTLVDTRPEGQVYKLLVDLTSGRIEEDISALLAAEAQAHQARYGKLEPALYERLQTLKDDDTVPVAVWVAAQPGRTLAEQQEVAFTTLAAKYPEAKVALARSGKPMDIDNPELAQRIEAEYIALLAAETKARVQPLVRELEQQGFDVTTYEGLPTFTAILPKRVVLSLAHRADVSSIYLVEAHEQADMDSAAPTILAPTVWGRGYDGSGVTIAILENGNVDSNNTYLNLSPTSRPGANNPSWHATATASAAASFHGTYRGIAYGATILSAGEDGTQADVIAALQWAFDQGARIINYSAGFEADADIHWTDRAFDYWTRQRFRLVVKPSGNTGGYITSPGKAWNLITVGGIEDGGDATWSNDQMWAGSAYTNPVSLHNDREKPEVVAVGADVTVLGNNNAIYYDLNGTSMAAPQVSGLAALLVDRNSSLSIWPEAARAIIMASATHNIEGPSIIVRGQDDLRDGAGAVNADLADRVAQTRGSESGTCYSSCWWGHSITNSGFPVGTDLERRFYADQGDLIRVAIAWWAHADTPGNNYSFDRLDTDLDLRIKAPNGQWVPGATSLSYDNNYEMVQFLAPQTGEYVIAVRKYRADEDSNYLGIALVRVPLPYRVYLPGVMKNYP